MDRFRFCSFYLNEKNKNKIYIEYFLRHAVKSLSKKAKMSTSIKAK